MKPEYQGLPGKDIGALKKSGVEVSDLVNHPLFAFMGDTSIEVFSDESVFQFPVIIVECTFIKGEEELVSCVKSYVRPKLTETATSTGTC